MLAYLLKVGALGTLDSRVPTFLLDRWETVGNSGVTYGPAASA